MATNQYMSNRKRWSRPQAMLWAENSGTLVDGRYAPIGYEKIFNPDDIPDTDLQPRDAFIVLSDHNRSAIDFKPIRIEQKQRMINGRMRSYHIADKLQISTSWDNLPSRSFYEFPNYSPSGVFAHLDDPAYQYTIDAGAGGSELLSWYEDHKGPFWVYLAYDKYENFDNTSGVTDKYRNLDKYSQILEMYISDFSYSVKKRGQSNHDLWTVNVTLEEV